MVCNDCNSRSKRYFTLLLRAHMGVCKRNTTPKIILLRAQYFIEVPVIGHMEKFDDLIGRDNLLSPAQLCVRDDYTRPSPSDKGSGSPD